MNTECGIPTEINNRAGARYDCDPRCLDRLRFHPYGIWSEDRAMRFYSPADPTHVSHSIVNLQHTETYFEAECRTVKSLMHTFGHSELSLLKLDVEGAEYEILSSLLHGSIRPGILCVEFDEGFQPMDGGYQDRIFSYIRRLRRKGYLLTHTDSWNATFVHETMAQKELV
jgi:FkbM family methyltransferase